MTSGRYKPTSVLESKHCWTAPSNRMVRVWSGVARSFALNGPGLMQTRTRFCKAATGKARIFSAELTAKCGCCAGLSELKSSCILYRTHVNVLNHWDLLFPCVLFTFARVENVNASSPKKAVLCEVQWDLSKQSLTGVYQHPYKWCQSCKIPFSFGESTLMNLYTPA